MYLAFKRALQLDQNDDEIEDDDEMAIECRRLAKSGHFHPIVMFYPNPDSRKHEIKPLNALSYDVRNMVRAKLSPFDFVLYPKTTKKEFKDILDSRKPSMVFISGHVIEDIILFEGAKGENYIKKDKLGDLLKECGTKCVFLACCKSNGICAHLGELGIYAIGFSTIVEDEAASDFCAGMVEYVDHQLGSSVTIDNIPYQEMYRSGLQKFKDKKRSVGDPEGIAEGDQPIHHGIPCMYHKEGIIDLTPSEFDTRSRSSIYNKYVKRLKEMSQKEEKKKCTTLFLENDHRSVVLFYASPSHKSLDHLKALDYDVRSLMRLNFSPLTYHIVPMTSLKEFEQIIMVRNPTIVFLSGHMLTDHFIFETLAGKPEVVSSQQFANVLNKKHNNIKCIFVAACHSRNFCEKSIKATLKNVTAIGFSTLIVDKAASAFSRGMCEYLKDKLFDDDIDYEEMYNCGINAFTKDYKVGNPEEYLGKCNHIRPEQNCKSCFPPVHGSPFLLKVAKGIPILELP